MLLNASFQSVYQKFFLTKRVFILKLINKNINKNLL